MAIIKISYDKQYLKRKFIGYSDVDLKREGAYYSTELAKIKAEIARRKEIQHDN